MVSNLGVPLKIYKEIKRLHCAFQNVLTLDMLGKVSADDILKYFLLFRRKGVLTFHANCF